MDESVREPLWVWVVGIILSVLVYFGIGVWCWMALAFICLLGGVLIEQGKM